MLFFLIYISLIIVALKTFGCFCTIIKIKLTEFCSGADVTKKIKI